MALHWRTSLAVRGMERDNKIPKTSLSQHHIVAEGPVEVVKDDVVDDLLEEDEDELFKSVRDVLQQQQNQQPGTTEDEKEQSNTSNRRKFKGFSEHRRPGAPEPSLEPYVGKLERFELFSTNQCYYIVACDKYNIQYRVLKMDRTLIEHPAEEEYDNPDVEAIALDAVHRAKATLRPLADFLTEDPNTYSQEEIQDMLDMIHHGNRYTRSDQEGGDSGGLKPLAKAYGIVGFVRFLDCYYLTLITRRAKVGSIGYNSIYTIKNVETFALKPAERGRGGPHDHDPLTDPSAMLLNMWNRGKRSVGLGLTNREIAELRYQGLYQVVDLTKNFYFSYSYDLTRSLQDNFLASTSQPFPPPPCKDMYAWNFFLTRELEACTNSLTSYHWVMPIIHGAFVQRKLNDYGRMLNLALIARRSRHFAGTRYLKRGVSEQGKVANDVEHEQIVHDESNNVTGGTFSSFLQVRGSIPTFWTQESSIAMPKPPIEINRVDPTYKATQAHFEDLMERYGSPVVVLDLVKQSEKREREVRVGNEFRHAVDYINTSIDDKKHMIQYCALDYSHISKHRNLDVSTSLNEVSTYAVNQTGFFCSDPQWKIVERGTILPFGEEDRLGAKFLSEKLGGRFFPMEQRGVLRTNCIDCLDRTNVAQFSAGVQALEQQLVVMGIRSSVKLDPSSTIIRVLIDMYVDIGDHIALQYGGSEAHKKVSAERSETAIPGPIGKHKELLTSIRRYYSNAFTDRLKQDAMNLLLGYYIPYRHSVPLWELETDYYLHNLHYKAGLGIEHTMLTYQRTFGLEWADDEDVPPPPPEIEKEETLANKPIRRSKLAKVKAQLRRGASDADVAESRIGKSRSYESFKIDRVRMRVKAQNRALSSWWKIAIQKNIQQRMWMQLEKRPSETLLPPRFDRIYQPNKLAQFDRFFARSWATPVRRIHASQQKKSLSVEDAEMLDYRRAISANTLPIHSTVDEGKDQDGSSLLEFCTERGYEPNQATSLKRFIAHASKDEVPSTKEENSTRLFLGRINQSQTPCEEYQRYTSSNSAYSESLRTYRPDKVEEYKRCLRDNTIHSDDVAGIWKLAESAHIESTLQSGPYRGLDHSESAIEVTTIVEEQLNGLVNHARTEDVGGMHLVDLELKRRGYHNAGIREAVARGWERTKQAQAQYAELVDRNSSSNVACRRSDLTTPASLELYSSFFDDSTHLSTLDLTFVQGEMQATAVPKKEKLTTSSGDDDVDMSHPEGTPKKSRFVRTAAKLGITIQAYEDIVKAKAPPLFSFERSGDVPIGFEQINEDLFARKDNKFMVFNGAGVDAWRGLEPMTKVYDPSLISEFSTPDLVETVYRADKVETTVIVEEERSLSQRRRRYEEIQEALSKGNH